MKINIEALEATLKTLTLKTEGSEDNPTTRSDISFECICEGKLADTLVGCNVDRFFWDKDKNIRLLGIENIESMAELKNATMEFGELKVEDVKVRKLKFQPINGKQLILKIKIQVHHTGEQLMMLDKLLMTKHPLKIYTSQDDLFSDDG